MSTPKNIFLVGPMGAGKSTIGRHVAKALGLEFFDTDQEIERRTGADVAWIFDVEGEDGFRKRERSVIEELTQKQGIVLATGGGAIAAPENRKCLAGRGVVIYLEASVDQQLNRTARDKKRPLLDTDNPRDVLESMYDERDVLYREIADVIVPTNGRTVKAVANDIVEKIQGGG